MTKTCSKCGTDQPASEFDRRARSKDGLQAWCRSCGRIASRDRYRRRRGIEGREPVARSEGAKTCRNCEQHKPLTEYATFPAAKDGRSSWCNACRAITAKAWAARNRDRVRAYHRDYKRAEYLRRGDVIRARLAAQRAVRLSVPQVPFTAEQWAAKCRYWGDRCWMCRGPVESMDHVKPVSLGGPHMLANLRPACRSCNSSKGASWPLALLLEAS